MTASEYRNAITKTLSETKQPGDSISVVREILGNCDAEFPYGELRGILAELSGNNFTQWRSCTYEEAKNFANEGIPTIGINANRVVVIASEDGGKIKSEFVISTPDECGLRFFAYSVPSVTAPFNWGTMSDVPSSMSADGFGGWYNPLCTNKGVVRRVPRFVQTEPGPCLAYSIMSGSHCLNYSTTDPNTFFNNRFTNGYIDSSGRALWGSFANVQSHNQATMKNQLNLGKPVVVSGNNGNSDHFVLVVSYIGCGASNSDYIVIDPWHTTAFPTTFAAFKSSYPNDTLQFKDEPYNCSYPMFTFI